MVGTLEHTTFWIHTLLEEPSNEPNASSRARAQHPPQSDSNAIIADLDERGTEFVAMIRGSGFGA